MELLDLLQALHEADVRLYIEEDELRFSAPTGQFTTELRDHVITLKPKIIEFLHEQDRQQLFLSPLPDVEVNAAHPLSHSQQRLWIESQLPKLNKAYLIENAFEIKSQDTIKTEWLSSCIDQLLEILPLWRSRFFVDSNNSSPELRQQAITLNELKSIYSYFEVITSDCPNEALDKHLQEKPFQTDIESGITFKITIFINQDNTLATAYLAAHHIIADAQSLFTFTDSLLNLYSNNKSGTFNDYRSWAVFENQADYISVLKRDIEFWNTYLNDLETLSLHRFKPQLSHLNLSHKNSDSKNILLDSALHTNIQSYCKTNKITPFIFHFATFFITLQRLCQTSNFCIGTAVDTRFIKQLENTIGPFINILPIKSIDNLQHGFSQYCQQLQTQFQTCYDYRHVGFEHIIQTLRKSSVLASEQNVNQSQLIETFYNFQELSNKHQADNTQKIQYTPVELSKADKQQTLQLNIAHQPNQTQIKFSRNHQEINDDFFNGLIDTYLLITKQVITRPSLPIYGLNLLTSKDIQTYKKINHQNRDSNPRISTTIYEAFISQVDTKPDRTAVEFQQQSLSFHELEQLTERIQINLLQHSIEGKERIGICINPCLELPALLLALISLNCTFVPIDLTAPEYRKRNLLKQSNCTLFLTDEVNTQVSFCDNINLAELLSTPKHKPYNKTDQNCENLAIFHTSGTTGQAKSVPLKHSSIWRRIQWMQEASGLDIENIKVLHKAPLSFDVSLWEIFWPLTFGHTLVIASQEERLVPNKLLQCINQHQVSHCHFVPSLMQFFLSEFSNNESQADSVQHVYFSGEELKPSLCEQVYENLDHPRVTNLYGPTEAAIDVSYFHCSKDDIHQRQIPIGTSIPNAELYLLDDNLQLSPTHAIGEIAIAGDCLIDAYLNNPDENAKRFKQISLPTNTQADAYEHKRVYLTGDYGRISPNGDIIFIGRHDEQIKHLGVRIELEEIRYELEQHASIVQAHCLYHKDQITAFYESSSALNPETLRNFLLTRLPNSHIPQLFIKVSYWPTTNNGKLDKKQLASHSLTISKPSSLHVEARTPLEHELTELWCELLELEKISIYDNFFALGGHSILAMQMLHHLQNRYDIKLDTLKALNAANIYSLAQIIEEHRENNQDLDKLQVSNIDNDQNNKDDNAEQEDFYI